MDVIDLDGGDRPVVTPDATSRPLFAGAASGELRYQLCPQCANTQHYPRALCIICGAQPEWATASGLGAVHTFTVIRQNGLQPFARELPYVVAIVELPEGVRMMGTLTGCEPEFVHIGMSVEAYGARTAEDMALVFWRPSSGAESGRIPRQSEVLSPRLGPAPS
jgi:uncharacterized OB-fold protein